MEQAYFSQIRSKIIPYLNQAGESDYDVYCEREPPDGDSAR